MSRDSQITNNSSCVNTWDTPNKLHIQNPTLDCHIFNVKLKDYPKEWIDQVRDKMLFLMETGIFIPISTWSYLRLLFVCLFPLIEHDVLSTKSSSAIQTCISAICKLVLSHDLHCLHLKHASKQRYLPLLQFIFIHIIPISWVQSCLKHSIISSAPLSLLTALNSYYRFKQPMRTYLIRNIKIHQINAIQYQLKLWFFEVS